MSLIKRILNYFHGPLLKKELGEVDKFGQFTESRFKVMYNPFSNEFYWCQLNVDTHVWEWVFVATHKDLYQWFQESDETKKYGFAVSELLANNSRYEVTKAPWLT